MSALTHIGYTDYAQLAPAVRKQQEAEGIRQAAQQFESLFVGMWLKAAREASAAIADDGVFSGHEMQMQQQMFDQQMALHLSQSGGIGLAPVIVRQLGGDPEAQAGPNTSSLAAPPVLASSGPAIPLEQTQPETASDRTLASDEPESDKTVSDETVGSRTLGHRSRSFSAPETFLSSLAPIVETVADQFGLPGRAILSQAALETGWGSHVLHDAGGRSSHNLFGIKADTRSADSLEIHSKEFEFGTWVDRISSFRMFENWEQGIREYAQMIVNQPRYQAATLASGATEFLAAVAESGYATDPNYGKKLNAVLSTVNRILDR